MNNTYYLVIIDKLDHSNIPNETLENLPVGLELQPGSIYLLTKGFSLFSQENLNFVSSAGYKVILISKSPEKDLKDGLPIHTSLKYMEQVMESSLSEFLFDSIKNTVSKTTGKEILFIKELDDLTSHTCFKQILHFIYKLKELVILKSLIVIISFKIHGVDSRNLRLLEKETKLIDLNSFKIENNKLKAY